MDAKKIVKSLFHRMGYDIRKRLNGFHDDPCADMKLLLKGRKVEVVFDVGAYIGYVALRYSELFPKAKVYAFEPFAESFQSLSELSRAHPRIHPENIAVTDIVGRKQFYLNKFSPTNSLLTVAAGAGDYLDAEWAANEGMVEVPCTTLHHYCTEHGIDRVQVLKMDIQGAELTAFRGATPLLESKSIDLIYCEVLFTEQYDEQAYFSDISKFLESFGYTLYGLYDLNYAKKTGILSWADAIFISPELRRTL
jgi:FkbM family methyltransferase